MRYRKRAIPSANMITNVAAPDHLDKFLCHVQCVCVFFFLKDQRKKDQDFKQVTMSTLQKVLKNLFWEVFIKVLFIYLFYL